MFYSLSKLLDFLLMPYNLSLILLFIIFWSAKNRKVRWLTAVALAGLYIQSNAYLVSHAYRLWETPPKDISSVKHTYEVGILLTGGLLNQWETPDFPQFGGNPDRLLAAFLLHQAGVVKKILITGTDLQALRDHGWSESQRARELLITWGVPPEAVILEENARNTYENAVYSAEILRKHHPASRYLLITSAFHMPRAVRCFEKAGIAVDAFPAGFFGTRIQHLQFRRMIIPDPLYVERFQKLWREWTGFLIYRIMGYC